MVLSYTWGDSDWILGKKNSQSGETLEQAVVESGSLKGTLEMMHLGT